MPGYPDHDGKRPERRKTDFWGLLCNPRGTGAGVARGAMIVCAGILSIGGPLVTWAATQVWTEFAATRKEMNEVSRKLDNYLSGAVVRGQGWEHRIAGIENDVKVLDHRADDIDRRLYRVEGRR